MKIKREIAKIISSSGDLQGATWEELRKIEKLIKLFKSYVRSLVPVQMRVGYGTYFRPLTYDGVERPALQLRYFCTFGKKEIEIENDVEDVTLKFRFLQVFEDGWNKCREEMLNVIDNGGDGSLIVKDGWRMNKEGRIEIQTGLDKHDDKWGVDKYHKFKEMEG